MYRPGRTPLALRSRPMLRNRQQKRADRICVGAMAAACAMYLASPYMTLASMGMAMQRHDQGALRSSLDWSLVRAGLKESLGLRPPVQQVSQQDELPGFGESFATGVASGMIDADITPERLGSMLGNPAIHDHGMGGLPHGHFSGPARFDAEIQVSGGDPIRITMRIEKWRWKITRITLPDDILNQPTPTHLASARS